MVLENSIASNRYTKAFLNVENVMALEEKDKAFQFPQNVLDSFKELKKKYDSFLAGIPLIIIERYYFEHAQDMNKYVYLEYDDNELDELKIIELYSILEDFHNKVFELACEIADLYNLEIKLNAGSNNSNSSYL